VHPNAPIVLFNNCDFELKAPNSIFCKGRIELRWQPSLLLHIEANPIKIKDVSEVPKLGTQAIINIPANPPISLNTRINQIKIDLKTNECGLVDNNISTLKLAGMAIDTRNDDTFCDEIKFHIANLKGYIGRCIIYPTNEKSNRRLVLKDGNWEINIDGVENIEKLIKELNQDGGFAITHVGILKQKGGNEFKFSEGLSKMDELSFFLSFAEGRWCCPILLFGMKHGEVTSYKLPPENSRINPWMGNWSWSEETQAENLEDAYWHFALKWKDPKWTETIAKVINFYIRAITYPVPEFSVLDSFTALDRLASSYDSEIEKKHGSERISSLLSHGDLISRDLPKDLYSVYHSFFNRYCTSKKANGPTILTEFRNGVVHGNKPLIPKGNRGDNRNRPKLDDDGDILNPPVPFEAMIQAKELGIWYVEMALLYLIGYGYCGEYNDRLAREKGVNVPWVKSPLS
jgi:hypothetical protein